MNESNHYIKFKILWTSFLMCNVFVMWRRTVHVRTRVSGLSKSLTKLLERMRIVPKPNDNNPQLIELKCYPEQYHPFLRHCTWRQTIKVNKNTLLLDPDVIIDKEIRHISDRIDTVTDTARTRSRTSGSAARFQTRLVEQKNHFHHISFNTSQIVV